MSLIRAWAAIAAGGPGQSFSYDPGPSGPDLVEISGEHGGICHSDLSMLQMIYGTPPTARVGVVGIGGLGYMALEIPDRPERGLRGPRLGAPVPPCSGKGFGKGVQARAVGSCFLTGIRRCQPAGRP